MVTDQGFLPHFIFLLCQQRMWSTPSKMRSNVPSQTGYGNAAGPLWCRSEEQGFCVKEMTGQKRLSKWQMAIPSVAHSYVKLGVEIV
jgi:hypothetical protein